jgi:hypothetical protein
MSDDNKSEKQTVNEVVAAMGDQVKPDVPTGLAVIPKGADVHALARRMGGQIVQNEMEYHCLSCGWSKSLQFDKDEMEALDNNIRDYTGPCPGILPDGSTCGMMTLTPKDVLWGNDFPSMSTLAQKNKRAEARVNAEEFVDVVAEKVGDMMGGGIPKPTIQDPADEKTETDEIDTSKLTPR